jgi:hypothetical protein
MRQRCQHLGRRAWNMKEKADAIFVPTLATLKERSGIWFGWSGKIAAHGTIATQTAVQNG